MTDIKKLLDVMRSLRNPDGGCPWDLEQDFQSIAPYTIEEAYEVADAIDRKDYKDLQDELGDLLLQVVYHSQMASEEKFFDFQDVVDGVTEKMIHRHPHVFGDEAAKTASDVDVLWEARKDKESKRKQSNSALDDVTLHLPALKRAQKLQKRAASTGFEWDQAVDVLDKFEEEIKEMRQALSSGKDAEIVDELGDLFFVLTNFGRMLGQDCEETLRQSNRKFERRFRGMEEDALKQGLAFKAMSLREKEELWQQQKNKEKEL